MAENQEEREWEEMCEVERKSEGVNACVLDDLWSVSGVRASVCVMEECLKLDVRYGIKFIWGDANGKLWSDETRFRGKT